MGVSGQVIAAAREAGAAEGVAASVLLAVAMVETNARAFAMVEGRPEPLIRFEGHYFDRRLSGEAQARARAAGLSHPKAGAVKNPAGQAARWALLSRAAAIDRAAAFESTSWGLGQVMGAHWKILGFADADALVALARGSAAGQFALSARFLRQGGLEHLLLSGDHAGFARRYNGPAYAQNRYDQKIASAHAKALRLLGESVVLLRLGSRGRDVERLQETLTARGRRLAADGIFGPLTHKAVLAFQRAEGLGPDGIAGPLTLGRLGLS